MFENAFDDIVGFGADAVVHREAGMAPCEHALLMTATNKRCVEICAGSGIQCNCASLVINHDWTDLLFDGNEDQINKGQEYFSKHPDTITFPLKLIHAWITAENVNSLITSNGYSGEIDLFSKDIDGVDFWIWNAIEAIYPRFVLAEIQAIWGCKASLTVPYFQILEQSLLMAPEFTQELHCLPLLNQAKRRVIAWSAARDMGLTIFLCGMMWDKIIFLKCQPKFFSQPFAAWAHDEVLPMVKDRKWQEM